MLLYRYEYDLQSIYSTQSQGWLRRELNSRIADGWRPISVAGRSQEAIVLLRRRRWFWQRSPS